MDTAIGNQCELAVVEASAAGDVGMKLSMTSVISMIRGITIILIIYTVILLIVGYRCGFRIVKYKIMKEKVTMSPVTYTAVRKAAQPRFEYSTLIDGCWDFDD